MIKLAAFDLDGTLLNDDLDITDENLNAVKRLNDTGCKIVIATGRPKFLVKEYVEKLGICDYYIACNGAAVKDNESNTFLIDEYVNPCIVKEIYNLCNANNSMVMAYSEEYFISENNYRVELFEKRNKKLPEHLKVKFLMSSDGEYISKNHPVNKVLIIEKEQDKYEKLYSKLSEYKELTVTQSSESFIDIMNVNISKRNALAFLAQHLNITKDEIIAFGDHYNDIEMLQFAGYAATTSNAVQEVKDICGFVSKSNNESGVAKAIDVIQEMNRCAK